MDIDTIIRTLHVLSGTAWFGEVLVINSVLIPSLKKMDQNTRNIFITTVFPKIFKLASHLSLIAVITGIHLVVSLTDANLSNLLSGRWGVSILGGGSLGIFLTIFHFFIENKLVKKFGISNKGDSEILEDVHSKLKILPRFGLVVISTIFLLMINAARGLY